MQPPLIESCRTLLSRYEVLFCDVWGVLHDGLRAFASANDALNRFRAGGGTVVLVSNAPMPSEAVARLLDAKAVDRAAWDQIVSSGDIALRYIKDAGYRKVHVIGPARRDADFFAAVTSVPLDEADAVACTGLVDDRQEQPEQYRPLLEAAAARKLPFVCANPDLAVHVGRALLPCAGALAAMYEAMGGCVFWAGKPHPIAYATALRAAADVRAAPIERSRILAIGDSVRTDLAAAQGAGIDALFITSGIHRGETLEALFVTGGPTAVAAAPALVW